MCRAPRKMKFEDSLPLATHLKIFSFVASVSGIVYLISDWPLALRSLVAYLPIWALCEFVHWVRMREGAKCRVCDFDPVLYKKDWREARRRIEAKLGKMADGVKVRTDARATELRQSREKNTPNQPPSP